MSCLNDYNLPTIINQLKCWCIQWRGQVQTIFPEGMTQIEQIQELFTAVKNTAEAQVEVMEKFCELYTFVHDFFENLDLQEEVNKKLEEMAESGELATLIASAGMVIKYYNTFADLKADEALQENQIVMTKGFYNIGDKGACIYLISSSGIPINNGLKARPIDNIYYLPCYGSTWTDDGTATKEAIEIMLSLKLKKIIFPDDTVLCKTGIVLPYNIEIVGASSPVQSICRFTGGGTFFSLGEEGNPISVLIENMGFWDNDATINPVTASNTPCDSKTTVFYLGYGVYSKFHNVKFNRCNYCVKGNPDKYNYTLDFVSCRIDSCNYGIVLGNSCQAVNVLRCDFNNDLTAIELGAGLGCQIVAFNQIEGCRIAVAKHNDGDLHVVYNYFDNNKFRDLIVFKDEEHTLDIIDFSYNYILAKEEPIIVDCNFPDVMLNIFENKVEAENAIETVALYLNNLSDNVTLFSNHIQGNAVESQNKIKLQTLVRSGDKAFTADCIYSASTNFTPDKNNRRFRMSDNNLTINLPTDNTFPVNSVLTFYLPLSDEHTANFSGNVQGKKSFTGANVVTAIKIDSSDWYVY